MALVELRRDENAAGDFFVDTTCIDCDLCRQIAPDTFTDLGDQSVVSRQPRTEQEEFLALKALVTCPTASIGATGDYAARTKQAVGSYPDPVDDNVYFCGFASESSYGASSYLIVRPEGNVLVDSPRFASPLVKRIAELGGIRWMFLTHRDDVADHERWARRFDAERILHNDDAGRGLSGVERKLKGHEAVALDESIIAIPTPGHTRGHTALLYRNKFLFSGDHLWWSENHNTLHASQNVCWYSWSEQVRSVERLLDYEFEWVLPGHGRRVRLDKARMREELIRTITRIKGATRPAAS